MSKHSSDTLERGPVFASLVKGCFSFLEEFGYQVDQEEETRVRYFGQYGAVVVYHGRLSFELGVEFYRDSNSESQTYSLGQLIDLADGKDHGNYQNPAARDPESIRRLLSLMADLVKKYAGQIFEGRQEVWSRLEAQRKGNALEMEISSRLSYARSEAEKAFREKRFGDVVTLFSGLENYLGPTDKQKLSYAKARAQ